MDCESLKLTPGDGKVWNSRINDTIGSPLVICCSQIGSENNSDVLVEKEQGSNSADQLQFSTSTL